jgi:hypothetical protein
MERRSSALLDKNRRDLGLNRSHIAMGADEHECPAMFGCRPHRVAIAAVGASARLHRCQRLAGSATVATLALPPIQVSTPPIFGDKNRRGIGESQSISPLQMSCGAAQHLHKASGLCE